MPIAIVLSGGGARGDFQIGALRYLYNRGLYPQIVCGTSVGAINGAKLAEGGAAALNELESIWLSLESNSDMYLEEPWLTDISDSKVKDFFQQTFAETAGTVIGEAVKMAFFPPLLLYNAITTGIDIIALTNAINTALASKSAYNLSPIRDKLNGPTKLNTEKVQRSGIKLRLAIVGLESGMLHYVTGSGKLLLPAHVRYHLYTTSAIELDVAIENFGYESEEVACYVYDTLAPGTVKLFRLANPATGDHLYTTSELERRNAVDNLGWQYEDAACYVFASQVSGTIPLHRLANPATGDHIYTTSELERRNAVDNLGWQYEDVACYVYDTPAPETTPLYRLVKIADPHDVGLVEGVIASASIPVIFPPVKLLNEWYVDGGVREILPIKAAIDLGADQVYGIVASRAISSATSFDGRNLIDIGERAVFDIMTDETVRNETDPPRGWGVPVTVIQPTIDVHDTMTIDPGLISISMAYGFMRAFDIIDGNTVSSHQLNELKSLSDQITQLRKQIWDMEYDANGIRRRPRQGSPLVPVPDPDVLRSVRKLKRQIKVLVDRRLQLGGAVPPGVEIWWNNWERHPWDPYIPTPWDRFISKLGEVPAEIFWPPRKPIVSVEPPSIPLGEEVKVTIYARDPDNGDPVNGKVKIHNFNKNGQPVEDELDTNTPREHYIFHMGEKRVFDPETRDWIVDDVEPTGTVHPSDTSSFQEKDLLFKFYEPQLHIWVEPSPIYINRPTSITVRARDENSVPPIDVNNGRIIIDNNYIDSHTNTSFNYTIQTLGTTGAVIAPGYPRAPIPFNLQNPPLPPRCDEIRNNIAKLNNGISGLQKSLERLNPRDLGDRAEMKEINAEITASRREISNLQNEARNLGCPT